MTTNDESISDPSGAAEPGPGFGSELRKAARSKIEARAEAQQARMERRRATDGPRVSRWFVTASVLLFVACLFLALILVSAVVALFDEGSGSIEVRLTHVAAALLSLGFAMLLSGVAWRFRHKPQGVGVVAER